MPSIENIKASNGSGNANLATIQSVRAALSTTIDVDTVLNINPAGFSGTMGTPHTFTDPVTSETITVISEDTAVDFIGHVDGSNLEIDAIAPGYTDNGSEIGDIVIIRPTTQWGDEVADILEVDHEDDGGHKSTMTVGDVLIGKNSPYPPQGYMQNGQISRSVATNDITVAIKTLAGTDPSATDPVYVRIGNTVRSITSALSVTKNDGTNWFDSGSASNATNGLDYFVYLGYNATDGVVIGFARFPYAHTYSGFSTTTTASNYGAISTITNASATDEYQNIGRFNATLSATASFNWSVPATDIVVNNPIYTTRVMVFTPTLSGTGAAIGNGTVAGYYVINGGYLDLHAKITAGSTTAWGTSTTGIVVPFPVHGTYQDDRTILGQVEYYDAAPAAFSGITAVGNSGTVLKFVIGNSAGTYVSEVDVNSTTPAPVAIGTGDIIRVTARYKILA